MNPLKTFLRSIMVVMTAALLLQPAFAAPGVAEKTALKRDTALKSYADSFFRASHRNPTQEAFDFIGHTFRLNGASLHTEGDEKHALNLVSLPFTEIVNFYDNSSVSISVAAMPTPSQVESYWANWNRVLANGKWNSKKFFRNKQEMYTLARYNVLVLTAHEYGHYFDFRYNVSGYQSTGFGLSSGKPLNCTEYLADKFAVAFINHLSSEKRFAALRGRYLALITSFNSSIPAKNRIVSTSFEQLEKNCSSIKIAQNGVTSNGEVSKEFFRSYVSAYFARHRALLGHKNFPSLPNLIQQTLTSRLPKLADYTNDKVSIRQLGEVVVSDKVTSVEFNSRGELWQFELGRTPEEGDIKTVSLIMRDQKGALKAKVNYAFPPEVRDNLVPLTPLIFNDKEIVLALIRDTWSYLQAEKESNIIYFLTAKHDGGSWSTSSHKVEKLPQPAAGEVMYLSDATPSGKLLVYQHIQHDDKASIYLHEVNRSDFSLSAPVLVHQGKATTDITLSTDNNRYFRFGTSLRPYGSGISLLEVRPNDTRILIGNGLDGLKFSANKTETELANIAATRFLTNSVLRIATGTDIVGKAQRRYRIHEITLK
jgi:hypothetical protein